MQVSANARCLGVRLSDDLTWYAHFEAIRGRCYSAMASLARLQRLGVSVDSLISLCKVLFIPVLTYGIIIWGGTYASQKGQVRVLLNDVIRTIFGLTRRSNVSTIMKEHHIPTIKQLYFYRVGCHMYKQVKLRGSGVRHPLRELPGYSIRGLHSTDVVQPVERTQFVINAPQTRHAAIWNGLPDHVRSATSFGAFRQKLLKFLEENV